MNNRINKKRLLLAIYVFLIIMTVGGLYYYLFINHLFSIPCFFHELTNFYCPGCGITRVFIALLNFDFYQALRYNTLIFCMIPFFLLYSLSAFKNWLYEKEYAKVNDCIWISFLVLTIIFGILRNIEIFDFLAPTVI